MPKIELEIAIADAKADLEAAEQTCRHRSEQLQIARDRVDEARSAQVKAQKNYLELLQAAAGNESEEQ